MLNYLLTCPSRDSLHLRTAGKGDPTDWRLPRGGQIACRCRDLPLPRAAVAPDVNARRKTLSMNSSLEINTKISSMTRITYQHNLTPPPPPGGHAFAYDLPEYHFSWRLQLLFLTWRRTKFTCITWQNHDSPWPATNSEALGRPSGSTASFGASAVSPASMAAVLGGPVAKRNNLLSKANPSR